MQIELWILQIERRELQIAGWILQKEELDTEQETAPIADVQIEPGNLQIERSKLQIADWNSANRTIKLQIAS
ncbi:hypothetical protein [Cytobacillus firmus]|uniref:hypothetical protein n=1 Tax=Cytobacillus firmus TaxID=1399 RepID=UPI001C940970|nr:hypothetical protein [Cytobacillus firmus]MBY6052589.1 hypothetical protein [Cytobacillus firmus]